ncbi:MAG: sigma 54-interacting transcriptional regulator [Hyphomicrobiaceae bacterium]|nr:sigma 54-interacting transcriptional regulator [Hyphomicrobiaceae bacterium]
MFVKVCIVAQWNTTVLIRGEPGAGKKLIAKAIYDNLPRSGVRIIKLNCVALPYNLL